MKRTLSIVGLVLILIGIVWILQGINILPGSFMTGQLFWAFMGLICLGLGTGALLVGQRKSPRS